MANFAHYFNSRFAGCRVLAHAYDQCRERDVTLYQIPGQVECVGVSDTVDRWIAPVAPNLFNVDIMQLFRDMNAGNPVTLPLRGPRPGQASKTGRRALLAESDALPSPEEPEPIRRRPGKSDALVRARRVLL